MNVTCKPAPADTMVDAIALSSPSGRTGKRARAAALRRLDARLRLDDASSDPTPAVQPSERESLLRQASELRELAARGMCVRKYRRAAERLERQADEANNVTEER